MMAESWRYMSNPYDDPNQSNYVYSDAPDVWMSMVDAYSLDGYISDFVAPSFVSAGCSEVTKTSPKALAS